MKTKSPNEYLRGKCENSGYSVYFLENYLRIMFRFFLWWNFSWKIIWREHHWMRISRIYRPIFWWLIFHFFSFFFGWFCCIHICSGWILGRSYLPEDWKRYCWCIQDIQTWFSDGKLHLENSMKIKLKKQTNIQDFLVIASEEFYMIFKRDSLQTLLCFQVLKSYMKTGRYSGQFVIFTQFWRMKTEIVWAIASAVADIFRIVRLFLFGNFKLLVYRLCALIKYFWTSFFSDFPSLLMWFDK